MRRNLSSKIPHCSSLSRRTKNPLRFFRAFADGFFIRRPAGFRMTEFNKKGKQMGAVKLIIAAVVLIIFFSCSGNKTVKSKNSAEKRIYINAVNPAGTEYPGGRGADELIIYSAGHGMRTGTNQFGLEAVAEYNRVVWIAGNNSLIPKRGYVISGHGEALRWISRFLYPGVVVKIEGDSLYINADVESKFIYAQYFIQKVRELKKNKVTALTPARFDSFKTVYNTALQEARSEKKNPDENIYKAKAEHTLQTAKDFYYASCKSPKSEVRAVWFRITSKTAAELDKEIKRIADTGFNMICPEIIYGGSAVYPEAHADLPQHHRFSGWDPLTELVRLCKKYELKLIPWVWVYHVGRSNSYLAENKSDWLALSRQKEHPSQVEVGYHFLCPSRSSVRKFWLEIYEKMIKTYDIDGLQLDYIRYPVSLPYEKGYCYCDSCRQKFQEQGHPDPFNIDPNNNPKEWSAWNKFRIKQINDFVADVRFLLDEMEGDVKLSADVFPIPEESKSSKMQDWELWLKKGWLDEIFTMSYTPDAETVRNDAELLAHISPKGRRAYVGLGPYQKFRPEILLKEIEYVREAGVDGVCLFAFQALTDEQIDALKKGPFRNKARID